MRQNFFGPDRAYHEARQLFVFKGNPPPPLEIRAPVLNQGKLPRPAFTVEAISSTVRVNGRAALSLDTGGNRVESNLRSNANETSSPTDEPLRTRLLGMLRRGAEALRRAQ
jgi:hypothetical protein